MCMSMSLKRIVTRNVISKDFFEEGAQTGSVGWHIYSYIHSNFAGGGHVPPVPPLATR